MALVCKDLKGVLDRSRALWREGVALQLSLGSQSAAPRARRFLDFLLRGGKAGGVRKLKIVALGDWNWQLEGGPDPNRETSLRQG